MDHAFSTLMFLFAAALLLYAGLLAVTKSESLLPLRTRASLKAKRKKAYVFPLSKGIALAAAAPALCGLTALWNTGAAFAVLIVGFVFFLRLGTGIMKKAESPGRDTPAGEKR